MFTNSFLNRHFNNEKYQLSLITGDASFRRYYRLSCGVKTYIVMDSDPQVVNNTPYVELNPVFSKHGFILPTILNLDEQQGFFLLNDLGSTHLADLLQDAERKNLLPTVNYAKLTMGKCACDSTHEGF